MFERNPTASDPALDRSDRTAADLRSFFIGEPARADQNQRLALRLRPGFGPALLLISDALAEESRHEQALEMLGQIRADDPLHGVAALRRAGEELEDRLEGIYEGAPA